ncbi:hypothetical protein Pelo_118 [Pelomyxa schiedti]|nr:hypothetical protein Pelo_118 [Pelomyxa schiedti]
MGMSLSSLAQRPVAWRSLTLDGSPLIPNTRVSHNRTRSPDGDRSTASPLEIGTGSDGGVGGQRHVPRLVHLCFRNVLRLMKNGFAKISLPAEIVGELFIFALEEHRLDDTIFMNLLDSCLIQLDGEPTVVPTPEQAVVPLLPVPPLLLGGVQPKMLTKISLGYIGQKYHDAVRVADFRLFELEECELGLVLFEFLSACTSIETIVLTEYNNIKSHPNIAAAVCASKNTLLELDISQSVVSSQFLCDVFAQCTNLRHLNLEAQASVDISVIKCMVANIPEMESLNFSQCPNFSAECLLLITQTYKNTLSTLFLDECFKEEKDTNTLREACLSIAQCTKMQQIKLAAVLPGLSAQILNNLPELRQLWTHSIQDVVFPPLLREITVNDNGAFAYCSGEVETIFTFCEEETDTISFPNGLRSLWVIQENPPPTTSVMGRRIYRALSNCSNLQILCCGSPVLDEDVAALSSHCQHLSVVRLLRNQKLTDNTIFHIARPCLVEINLSSPEISDLSVFALAAHCPWLVIVQLGGCTKITDRGAITLLKNCHRILLLDLAGTSVTAQVANYVAMTPDNAPALRMLGLPHTLDIQKEALVASHPRLLLKQEKDECCIL